ncbi:hypothetical protein [Kallotenue papyrolyticum]|uniref:hypothetical protein n=1 Tax=Kallotenue papyrolyticum TaxID=1325125 RepID=UPI00047855EF|nr:hypothetical protein [Kallotenue papyrolyticum]
MAETIAQHLKDVLRQQIGQGTTVVQVAGDAATVVVEVEACERYAVGLRGMTVAPLVPVPDVRRMAEQIVQRVHALDEALCVVEQDAALGRAIVRSAQPERDQGGVAYWEVDVQPAALTLRRYHKAHSAPERTVETAPLPYARLGQVAEQLVEAVARTDDRPR